ncbi:hypothetical protein PMAYCL1PPCAC_22754, partial [Pristionchus mayeri]
RLTIVHALLPSPFLVQEVDVAIVIAISSIFINELHTHLFTFFLIVFLSLDDIMLLSHAPRRKIGSDGDPTAEGEKEREEESSHRSNMGDRPMEGLFIGRNEMQIG